MQRMAPAGTELIVGIVGDPDFGPVVACGAGGRAVELLGDVASGSRRSAAAAARRCCARFGPSRCSTATAAHHAPTSAAVEDVLLRVSALAAAHPEIAELDCNPLHARPDGALVLDARMRVAGRRRRGRSRRWTGESAASRPRTSPEGPAPQPVRR